MDVVYGFVSRLKVSILLVVCIYVMYVLSFVNDFSRGGSYIAIPLFVSFLFFIWVEYYNNTHDNCLWKLEAKE